MSFKINTNKIKTKYKALTFFVLSFVFFGIVAEDNESSNNKTLTSYELERAYADSGDGGCGGDGCCSCSCSDGGGTSAPASQTIEFY